MDSIKSEIIVNEGYLLSFLALHFFRFRSSSVSSTNGAKSNGKKHFFGISLFARKDRSPVQRKFCLHLSVTLGVDEWFFKNNVT